MLEQFLNFGEVGQAQAEWLHLERLSRSLSPPIQSEPYRPVDYLLERFSGLPHFLVQQRGNVVVESDRGSHIMMLVDVAS
jgi:hypothetical protein